MASHPLSSVQRIGTTFVHECFESLSLKDETSTLPHGDTDLAGMDAVLQALREIIHWPVTFREEAAVLGLSWPRGLLLHGPPGVGKTSAVLAVARECNAIVHMLSAASIFGAYTGQSERNVRDVFDRAKEDAVQHRDTPVVLFIDEIDALCPKRDSHRQHESRVVAQVLTLMDGAEGSFHPRTALVGSSSSSPYSRFSSSEEDKEELPCSAVLTPNLCIIASTNRPNALDPALRRQGRFDREVSVPVPDEASRKTILKSMSRCMPLSPDVDLDALATSCYGYTGADLRSLCREAVMKAVASSSSSTYCSRPKDSSHTSSSSNAIIQYHHTGCFQVSNDHFLAAKMVVGPSIARSVALKNLDDVSWDDIGGLEEVKKELKKAVEWPLRHADAFRRLGISAPRGVLLHGPPGCSKTTLVKATATASGATFIALSGAQIYSMYVGEGEEIIRDAFHRARMTSPSIVFLDELDSLVGTRTSMSQVDCPSERRILSTLLTEIDGLERANGVLIMAATNNPKALDPALIRPGRFDSVVFVPPPSLLGRKAVLELYTRDMPLAHDVDLYSLAQKTEYFTGAELAALCREAALSALRETLDAREVGAKHFDSALAGCTPLLNQQLLKEYRDNLN